MMETVMETPAGEQPVSRAAAHTLREAAPDLAALYEEHSRAIYYLCLRLLSDPQKAEDATHDVFLKAFRKMEQFRGETVAVMNVRHHNFI